MKNLILVRGLLDRPPSVFEVPRSQLYVPAPTHWTWLSARERGLTLISPDGVGLRKEWIYIAAMMRVDDSLFQSVFRARPVFV